MKKIRVDINPKVIIATVAILFSLYFAYQIKNVLLMFFFAFIINAGIRPLVDRLQKQKVPRSLSIVLIYSSVIALIVFVVAIVANQIIDQIVKLIELTPDFAREILSFIRENVPGTKEYLDSNEINDIVVDLRDSLVDYENLSNLDAQGIARLFVEAVNVIGNGGITIIGSIAGGLISIFTVFMVSIYMLNRDENVYESIIDLAPHKYARKLKNIMKKIEVGLGEWLIGQLALMFIIGFATYLIVVIPAFFTSDDVYTLYKFALVIALVAGFLEALPQIGPFITLVLVVILTIGTGGSFAMLIYIIAAFLLLQQAEGALIVPMVMKRAIDIDPVLTILSIIAGLQLGGPLLALIAVPIVAILKIIVLELSREWKESAEAEDAEIEAEADKTPKKLKIKALDN